MTEKTPPRRTIEDAVRLARINLVNFAKYRIEAESKIEALQQENARLWSKNNPAPTSPSTSPRARELRLSLRLPKKLEAESGKGSVRFSRRSSLRLSSTNLGTLHEVSASTEMYFSVREKLYDLRDSKLSKPVIEKLFQHADYIAEVEVTEAPTRRISIKTLCENRSTVRTVDLPLDADWYLVKMWARIYQIPIVTAGSEKQ